jgi:hypothetical protein
MDDQPRRTAGQDGEEFRERERLALAPAIEALRLARNELPPGSDWVGVIDLFEEEAQDGRPFFLLLRRTTLAASTGEDDSEVEISPSSTAAGR